MKFVLKVFKILKSRERKINGTSVDVIFAKTLFRLSRIERETLLRRPEQIDKTWAEANDHARSMSRT